MKIFEIIIFLIFIITIFYLKLEFLQYVVYKINVNTIFCDKNI